MKKLLLLLLYFFVLFLRLMGTEAPATEEAVKHLLMDAMLKTRQSSFSAELASVPHISPRYSNEMPAWLPNWKYFRQVRPDGQADWRIEMSNVGKTREEVYLTNQEGTFGINTKKQAAKILFCNELLLPEELWRDVPEKMLNFMQFSCKMQQFNGMEFYEITMTLPDTQEAKMAAANTEDHDLYQDIQSSFPENIPNQPVRTVYWVNAGDGRIWSKQEYAADGRKVFAIQLKTVDWSASMSSDLFATPDDLIGQFTTRHDLEYAKRRKDLPPNLKKTAFQRFCIRYFSMTGLLKWGPWVGGGIALAVLFLLGILKLRSTPAK